MSKKTEVTTEETKTFKRRTIEEVIAQLGELIGSTDEDVMKLFSQLTEYDIEEVIFALDIYNTYRYAFLITYIYDKLRLNVSLDRLGRTGLENIVKTPFAQEGSEAEKSRLNKLRDLFR